MGCCNSRIKDPKDKTNNKAEDQGVEGIERTINDLIKSNMKKRQKSFMAIGKKKLSLQNSDFMINESGNYDSKLFLEQYDNEIDKKDYIPNKYHYHDKLLKHHNESTNKLGTELIDNDLKEFPFNLSSNNKRLLNNRLKSILNNNLRNNKIYSASNEECNDNDPHNAELDYNYLTSKFGNFNYDREKINNLNLDKISKKILNNNHLILKLTEGNLDCSIESDNSYSHNKSVLNTSNVLSMSAFTNQENFLIDKNNDLNISNDYITIKSNIINSCNVSRISIKSEDDNLNNKNRNFNFDERCDELLNALNKRDCESIVFLFEIFFIILWSKEFSMLNNSQEECLILIIELNDDYTKREKVFLRISDEEHNKFIPFGSKNLAKESSFKFIRKIKRPDANNYEKSVHKISLKICSYSKDILSIICEEEIFINTRQEGSLHKYKFYKNMYGTLQNKKLANILFNITYKKNELYNNNNTYTNHDSGINSEYNTNHNLNNLSKIEKFSNFQEETVLPFIYYGIKNQTILLNGSTNNAIKYNNDNNNINNINNNINYNSNNLNDFSKIQRTNFFSIHDIEELEISGELKSEWIPIDRLIDLLSISKKKFELYEILRKLNHVLLKQEIAFESLILIMQKIVLRLDEIKCNIELHDEVLTPFIYFVLKNILIKIKKYLDSNAAFIEFKINKNVNNAKNTKIDKNISLLNKNELSESVNDLDSNFKSKELNKHKANIANKINNLNRINNSNYVINDELSGGGIYTDKSKENNNASLLNNCIKNNSGKKVCFMEKIDDSFHHLQNNEKNEIYKNSNLSDNYKFKQLLKSLKEIIMKSFFLAMKNIEFQNSSNCGANKNTNLNVFNQNLRKRTSINYDSFFNWNRKKIISSISYLAKLFEDFVNIAYNKSGNNVLVSINFKINENLKNNGNNNYCNELKKELYSKSVTCQIDQDCFSIFMNNLYFLINHGSNFYDNADLVFNIQSIQLKIIRNKEFANMKEIMFENLLTDEIYFNVSKNYKNNIDIQTNLNYLSSVYYIFMNSNFPEVSKFNLESIIDFNDLLESFSAFKTCGFDQIHETILNLIKTLLTSKKKIINTNKQEEDNNNFSLNNTHAEISNYESNNNNNTNNKSLNENDNFNTNKSISTQLKSEDVNQKKKIKEKENKLNKEVIKMLSENELKIIVCIFTSSIKLLRTKIINFDIQKLLKWTQNIMTIIYSVANISNNIPKIDNNFSNLFKYFYQENFVEEIIELLNALSEIGLFSQIDLLYGKIDENSINVKSIIFRSLYNCVILIKSIREAEKNSMNKTTAEKIFKFIKKVEENDNKFNPLIIKERIQMHMSKGEHQKNSESSINFLLLDSLNFKHLMEYYTRYKSILKDFLRDTIIFIKQSQRKII